MKATVNGKGLLFGYIFGVLLIPFLGIGLLIIGCLLSYQYTTRVTVSEDNIEVKTGWIFKTIKNIRLGRVESIDFNQGPIARINDYGTISCDIGKEFPISISAISNFGEIKEFLQTQIESAKSKT